MGWRAVARRTFKILSIEIITHIHKFAHTDRQAESTGRPGSGCWPDLEVRRQQQQHNEPYAGQQYQQHRCRWTRRPISITIIVVIIIVVDARVFLCFNYSPFKPYWRSRRRCCGWWDDGRERCSALTTAAAAAAIPTSLSPTTDDGRRSKGWSWW